MTRVYTIYKATNRMNGKCYVGFDSQWPHRKSAHKHAALKKDDNRPFERAICKYGFESFDWEILFQSEDVELTKIMECEFIESENSYVHTGHGYNLTHGGEGSFGWVPSRETREKISKSNLGKKAWNEGLLSPWTAERNKANKGCKQPKLLKKYRIVNPEGQEFIVEGLVEFCKEYKLHAGNMSSVASGKLRHYKNWLCQRLDK